MYLDSCSLQWRMMFGEEVLRVFLPGLSESLFVCRGVGLTDSSDDKAEGSWEGNGGIHSNSVSE